MEVHLHEHGVVRSNICHYGLAIFTFLSVNLGLKCEYGHLLVVGIINGSITLDGYGKSTVGNLAAIVFYERNFG